MIQVQVCGRERQRQRRRDYSNTSIYHHLSKKKTPFTVRLARQLLGGVQRQENMSHESKTDTFSTR
jgi:hypothetical protein